MQLHMVLKLLGGAFKHLIKKKECLAGQTHTFFEHTE